MPQEDLRLLTRPSPTEETLAASRRLLRTPRRAEDLALRGFLLLPRPAPLLLQGPRSSPTTGSPKWELLHVVVRLVMLARLARLATSAASLRNSRFHFFGCAFCNQALCVLLTAAIASPRFTIRFALRPFAPCLVQLLRAYLAACPFLSASCLLYTPWTSWLGLTAAGNPFVLPGTCSRCSFRAESIGASSFTVLECLGTAQGARVLALNYGLSTLSRVTNYLSTLQILGFGVQGLGFNPESETPKS